MTHGEDMADNKAFTKIEILLILITFTFGLIGSLLLPMDQCPDEEGRVLLTDWIVNTGTLPTGNEAEVMIPGWGFSYALRPYLSSMIGAVCVKVASLLTLAPCLLLAASRSCSVLSLTACCYFCLCLGHRLFEKRGSAILLAVFVCYIPQVQFLGMYLNNDILSLAAVSAVLCFLVEGFDDGWSVRSCVKLGMSLSVLLLSYYSAYGWCLAAILFCVLAVRSDPRIPQKGRFFWKRSVLVAGICLLLAGWFFVRNAGLHEGDFLGVRTESVSRALCEAQGYDLYPYNNMRNNGYSIQSFLDYQNGEFLRITARSFFGVFGYMLIYFSSVHYSVYYTVALSGVALYLAVILNRKPDERDALLMLAMLLASAITFALHFWASYARDYQPQGRYIITLALPLGYMLAYGVDHAALSVPGREDGTRRMVSLAPVYIALWLLLFLRALPVMAQMLA